MNIKSPSSMLIMPLAQNTLVLSFGRLLHVPLCYLKIKIPTNEHERVKLKSRLEKDG